MYLLEDGYSTTIQIYIYEIGKDHNKEPVLLAGEQVLCVVRINCGNSGLRHYPAGHHPDIYMKMASGPYRSCASSYKIDSNLNQV